MIYYNFHLLVLISRKELLQMLGDLERIVESIKMRLYFSKKTSKKDLDVQVKKTKSHPHGLVSH